MNITGFFPSSPLAWGRNWEWPLRHSLSHAVIVFTSAVARLIITNSHTHKGKKSLSFCPRFLLPLHSSRGRRYFQQAIGKRKFLVLLSFALEQNKAAEKTLRRSRGGRLPGGAILLALLELGEICSGHYETFTFAFQLKCGNWLSRTLAKPASSQLDTTFSSSYLPDVNCIAAAYRENAGPFVTGAAETAQECHKSVPLLCSSSWQGLKRRDSAKDLNI